MFAVSSRRTMAGARPKLSPPTTTRRAVVIGQSRKWQEEQGQARPRDEGPPGADPPAHRGRAGTDRGAASVPPTDPRDIIAMVAAWHGFTYERIIAQGRARPLMLARHDAVAAVYLNCRLRGEPLSLHKMGQIFDRDHASIHQSLQRSGVK